MRACSLNDVPEEGALRVQLDGKPICIARSQGEVFALHDVCSHADVALSEGDVEDAGASEPELQPARRIPAATTALARGMPNSFSATRP